MLPPRHQTEAAGNLQGMVMNISRARRIPTQTRQISPQTKITDCQWDGWSDKTKLCVKWSDGHKSVYPQSLFIKKGSPDTHAAQQGLTDIRLFDRSIAEKPPTVDHADLTSEKGMAAWTSQIRTHGFCYIKNCPVSPEATQELVERIGPIRHTHYGGFWDFTSDLSSKDTAYTTLALEAHTDTTYFSEPAGLQLFHLLSHTSGSGGASLLVDGFAAAFELYMTDKRSYEILSTVGVYSHASGNEDVSVQPYTSFPVLVHDPYHGHLVQVRWNNADRAGIELPLGEVDVWYEAAAKFDAILNKPEYQYWEQLRPGTPLIFDNWRVLHGRSSFNGKRRLCGAYVNRDDFISKYKLTNLGRDEVLATTVTG
ncbi:hypothetical protein H2203_007833 [Taxawa tesnikishii (nom. ined.)]|nr:hypothetical protein H2203_007833 [Dothideales sp. JES 119]